MRRRPEGSGCLYRQRTSRYWWMKYYVGKKVCCESTKIMQRRKAEKVLAQRLAEVRMGHYFGPEWERSLLDELAEDLFAEYRFKGRKSLSDVERRWHKHLKPFFGARRSNEITTEYVKQYVSKRLNDGAQNGTVNRELAVLRRMYSLALSHTPRKVNPNRVPQVIGLRESNP